MSNTLVLGVGNIMHTDAGAGVYAMRYLKDHYDLPDTTYIDAGTLSLALGEDIAAAQNLIVFDAVQMDAEPGTVRLFQDAEVDEFLKSARGSVHEVSLADLMDVARLDGNLPDRYALIGIQPEKLDIGEAPSETVRRVMPRAAGNAASLIHKWRRPIPNPVRPQPNASP